MDRRYVLHLIIPCTEVLNFEPSAKFTDDLKNKPLMQQLWAGDKLTADEKQINQSSEGLALFLGCNSFVDYEMGRVLECD